MEKTYKMLTTLIVPGTENMKLEDIAREYGGSLSPSLLALAFHKLYRLIYNVSSKYYGLSTEDIASFALEKLDQGLITFSGEGCFTTYFTVIFKNKLREETESLNTHKRKAMFYSDSFDALVEEGFDIVDETAATTEILDTLTMYKLSTNETTYCKLLLREYTNKEISGMMGISVMALCNMRKKLKIKLSPLALDFC